MKNQDVVKTIESGNYVAQIILDSDVNETPRDWENLGTMVCFHNRYILGDMENKNRLHGKGEHTFEHDYDFRLWLNSYEDTDEKKYKLNPEIAVILPLYLYDHSGLSISTGGFYDQWDSSTIGCIFVTKEQLKKEYSKKVCTKQIKELAKSVLEQEVKVYDQYLTGEVYGYKLYKIDPSNFQDDEEFDSDYDDPEDYGEELDSCWGFYGMESIKEEIKSMIDWHKEKDAKDELALTESMWNAIPVNEYLMQES